MTSRLETLRRRLDRALRELDDARDRRAPSPVLLKLECEASYAEVELVRALEAGGQ